MRETAPGPATGALLAPNLEGALWMLTGGVAFTLMGAIMKHLGATLPIEVIVFFRMGIGLLSVVVWVLLADRATGFRTSRPGLQVLRSVFGLLSLFCFVYSLRELDLATATALAFTTPLWMIVVSALFLGERGGPARAVATAIGFVGVLLIVRPHLGIEPAMLVALAGAVLASVSLMLVRKLSFYDGTLAITFYFSLLGTLMSAIPAALAWHTPSPSEAALLSVVGFSGALGLYCAGRAYRIAAATIVAPVDFARLPMAAIIGVMLFQEIPDPFAVLGMFVIGVSLLVVVRRSRT